MNDGTGWRCVLKPIEAVERLIGVHRRPYEERTRKVVTFLSLIACSITILIFGSYRLVDYFYRQSSELMDLVGSIIELSAGVYFFFDLIAFLIHRRFGVMMYLFIVVAMIVLGTLHFTLHRGFNSYVFSSDPTDFSRAALLFYFLIPHFVSLTQLKGSWLVAIACYGLLVGLQTYDIVDLPSIVDLRSSLIIYYVGVTVSGLLLYLSFQLYRRKNNQMNSIILRVAEAISTLDLEHGDVVKLKERDPRYSSEVFRHLKKILDTMTLYNSFLPPSLKSIDALGHFSSTETNSDLPEVTLSNIFGPTSVTSSRLTGDILSDATGSMMGSEYAESAPSTLLQGSIAGKRSRSSRSPSSSFVRTHALFGDREKSSLHRGDLTVMVVHLCSLDPDIRRAAVGRAPSRHGRRRRERFIDDVDDDLFHVGSGSVRNDVMGSGSASFIRRGRPRSEIDLDGIDSTLTSTSTSRRFSANDPVSHSRSFLSLRSTDPFSLPLSSSPSSGISTLPIGRRERMSSEIWGRRIAYFLDDSDHSSSSSGDVADDDDDDDDSLDYGHDRLPTPRGDDGDEENRPRAMSVEARRSSQLNWWDAYGVGTGDDAKVMMASIVTQQRTFLAQVSSVVNRFGGLVHDYRGGIVICSFNTAVRPCERHCSRACLCALELTRIHDSLSDSNGIRIAICRGMALYGNTGCEQIRRFEVLGDPVDRATELMRKMGDVLPKELSILVDDAVRFAARLDFDVRLFDHNLRTDSTVYWLAGINQKRHGLLSSSEENVMINQADRRHVITATGGDDPNERSNEQRFEGLLLHGWNAFFFHELRECRAYCQLAALEPTSHRPAHSHRLARLLRRLNKLESTTVDTQSVTSMGSHDEDNSLMDLESLDGFRSDEII